MIFPIEEGGKGDYPSIRELHLWMGYPSMYAAVRRMSFDTILRLIGQGWNVHQFFNVLRPLQYLFKMKHRDIQ